jgi:hypothetical protein
VVKYQKNKPGSFISYSTKANLGFSNFLLLASGSLDSCIAVLLVLIGTQWPMGGLTELVINIVNWSVIYWSDIYRTGQLFTGQIFTELVSYLLVRYLLVSYLLVRYLLVR